MRLNSSNRVPKTNGLSRAADLLEEGFGLTKKVHLMRSQVVADDVMERRKFVPA